MQRSLVWGIVVLALTTWFSIKMQAATSPQISSPHETLNKTPSLPPQKMLADHFSGLEVSIGSPYAPLTVIMYYSLTCPHCHEFQEKVMPKIQTDYINKGLVRFIFRDFPTDQLALRAAKIAWCTGKDHYLLNAKKLLATQDIWAPRDPTKFQESEKKLKEIALQLGIHEADYKRCIANKETEETILRTSFEAQRIHQISAAPAFIINGRVYDGILTPEHIQEQLLEMGIYEGSA